MKDSTWYPRLAADGDGAGLVSQAGTVLLVRAAERIGLVKGLSEALAPWRKPLATHDPGKTVLDLAIAVAAGADCVSDVVVLRDQPGVFGPVASDPTISRLITTLAADAPKVLSALTSASAAARAAAWSAAGDRAPDHGIDAEHPLIIDLDATLLDAHSEKERAAPTFKRGFGFHPLLAFIDHGSDGTGEPAAALLRAGNAGANTAADHKKVLHDAIAQLPWQPGYRVGKKILVRADAGGGTHEFLGYCHARRVQYSVGFGLNETIVAALDLLPDTVWTPAYDGDGEPRDGAAVAEITGLIDLTGWPPGIRVIIRRERPHPGAQLRFTDHNGNRLTAFATNTRKGQLADLELRHRRRARCESQ
ncbi:hypothetical protein ABIA39_004149 [Nocardia sp. GAS34]